MFAAKLDCRDESAISTTLSRVIPLMSGVSMTDGCVVPLSVGVMKAKTCFVTMSTRHCWSRGMQASRALVLLAEQEPNGEQSLPGFYSLPLFSHHS